MRHNFPATLLITSTHTIHHTDYKTNYGHYFTYMDYIFGTLLPPDEYKARIEAKSKSKTT